MIKTTTDCCALCQISGVHNGTTKGEFEDAIALLSKQKLANTEVGISRGNGQTSVFVIATPNEVNLKETLKSVGFKHVNTFERRKGYPDGLLDMYIKNF